MRIKSSEIVDYIRNNEKDCRNYLMIFIFKMSRNFLAII